MQRSSTYAGLILLLGFGLCLASFIPKHESHSEPYLKPVQSEKVQQDGTVSAFYTYYQKCFTSHTGDKITVKASTSDANVYLTVSVNGPLGTTIKTEEKVKQANFTVTASEYGSYCVTVERWRESIYVLFLTETSAHIYVKTAITNILQDYRKVTTTKYPYKDLFLPGIAIMVGGIGLAVITGFTAVREKMDEEEKRRKIS